MEIKSIKNSRQPNYPTIELFVKHPELLSNNIPNTWMKNKIVATSLVAFLLYGCTSTTQKKNTIEVVDGDLTAEKPAFFSQKDEDNKKIIANIAPIFAHGEGSGATGCVVMSPPVFLSEDEAIKIIWDALRAEDYNFDTTNCPTFSFKVLPLANCKPKGKTDIKLKMDAYNANSKWAIQFISIDDFNKFATEDGCWSSVSIFDTKQAAEIINNQLKKKQKTNAVVFYDPITHIDSKNRENWENWEESRKTAKEKSKKLLTAQVNDFIKWLKTNNITIE
jgi:hypothetical protein